MACNGRIGRLALTHARSAPEASTERLPALPSATSPGVPRLAPLPSPSTLQGRRAAGQLLWVILCCRRAASGGGALSTVGT